MAITRIPLRFVWLFGLLSCFSFSQKLKAQVEVFQDWSEYPNFFITIEFVSYSENQNLISIRGEKHVYPPRWNGQTYYIGVWETDGTNVITTASSSFQTSISPDVSYRVGIAYGGQAYYANNLVRFSADGNSEKWYEIHETYTNTSGETKKVRMMLNTPDDQNYVVGVALVPPGGTYTWHDQAPEGSVFRVEEAYSFDGVLGWAQIETDYDTSGVGGGVPTGVDGAQAQYITSAINQQTGTLSNKFEEMARQIDVAIGNQTQEVGNMGLQLGEIVQGTDGILAKVTSIDNFWQDGEQHIARLTPIANSTAAISDKMDDVINQLDNLEVTLEGDGLEVDNTDLIDALHDVGTVGAAEVPEMPLIDDEDPDVTTLIDLQTYDAERATFQDFQDVLLTNVSDNLVDRSYFWDVSAQNPIITLPFPVLDTDFQIDLTNVMPVLNVLRDLFGWWVMLMSYIFQMRLTVRALEG